MFLTRFFNAPLSATTRLRRTCLEQRKHRDLPHGEVTPFIDMTQGTYTRVSFLGRVCGAAPEGPETIVALEAMDDEHLAADFAIMTMRLAILQTEDETRAPYEGKKNVWSYPERGLIYLHMTGTTYIVSLEFARAWLPDWKTEGDPTKPMGNSEFLYNETLFCTAHMVRIKEVGEENGSKFKKTHWILVADHVYRV
uniref:Uncharacterized protein n=1 Tax=Mycena chlorophos TaxID=658473 RepID=A0ABQ0L8M3_MYCCL|nr:predicted protein [Mycena chlorophos]